MLALGVPRTATCLSSCMLGWYWSVTPTSTVSDLLLLTYIISYWSFTSYMKTYIIIYPCMISYSSVTPYMKKKKLLTCYTSHHHLLFFYSLSVHILLLPTILVNDLFLLTILVSDMVLLTWTHEALITACITTNMTAIQFKPDLSIIYSLATVIVIGK